VDIAQDSGFEETLDFESWAQAASADNPLLVAAVERFRR
jgi:hypothetical protein